MDDRLMTVRIAPDARCALERWAKENLTNMTAELNRAIRERAARERQEKGVAG